MRMIAKQCVGIIGTGFMRHRRTAWRLRARGAAQVVAASGHPMEYGDARDL